MDAFAPTGSCRLRNTAPSGPRRLPVSTLAAQSMSSRRKLASKCTSPSIAKVGRGCRAAAPRRFSPQERPRVATGSRTRAQRSRRKGAPTGATGQDNRPTEIQWLRVWVHGGRSDSPSLLGAAGAGARACATYTTTGRAG
jgi:hypothetical protein